MVPRLAGASDSGPYRSIRRLGERRWAPAQGNRSLLARASIVHRLLITAHLPDTMMRSCLAATSTR